MSDSEIFDSEDEQEVVIFKHYNGYKPDGKKKKNPAPTREIIVDLNALYTWYKFFNSNDDLNELEKTFYRISDYLSKNSVDRIIWASKKKRAHQNIDHPSIIKLMTDAIRPALEWYSQKPKRGAPHTKLWHVIAVHARAIGRLRNQGITVEYLWSFFQMVDEVETPDFEAFKKTLQSALKKGKK